MRILRLNHYRMSSWLHDGAKRKGRPITAKVIALADQPD